MRLVHLNRAVFGATALLLAVGGCSGPDSEAGEDRRTAQSAEVTWAGKVCGAVADGAAKVPRFPQLDPTTPEKLKQGFVEHVRTLSGAMGEVRDDVDELGAPPVKQGEATHTKTVSKLGKAVKSLDKATAKLEKAEAEDQQAMREALAGVRKAVEKAGTAKDLVKDLRENAELDKAVADAPACREFAG